MHSARSHRSSYSDFLDRNDRFKLLISWILFPSTRHDQVIIGKYFRVLQNIQYRCEEIIAIDSDIAFNMENAVHEHGVGDGVWTFHAQELIHGIGFEAFKGFGRD